MPNLQQGAFFRQIHVHLYPFASCAFFILGIFRSYVCQQGNQLHVIIGKQKTILSELFDMVSKRYNLTLKKHHSAPISLAWAVELGQLPITVPCWATHKCCLGPYGKSVQSRKP